MPGITGIIVKNAVGDEETKLSLMLNSMLHEEFYSYGTYIHRENGFFIGYSSIKESFSDCMPIFNEDKSLVLFLTGECYLDNQKIDQLRHLGHSFNQSNAEIIIHLYEEDEGFFQNLNGWYNGIILDLKKQRAILFNDRYGIRRIYYYENQQAFFFSSEAKSLLKILPSLRALDPKSVGEYLAYDCVLENRTFFSDIFLLPSGSTWNFEHRKVEKKRYFDSSELENQTIASKDDFLEELSDVFIQILPRYFTGKKVGLSLTGGLDTRMILAGKKLSPGELPCYTYAGSYRETLDERIAPRVARACGQTHEILRLDDNKFLSEYPSHVEKSIYISDGLQNVEKADGLYFSKLSRQIAPIRLTGIYGSQVLKGVSGLQERLPYSQLINPDFNQNINSALETYSSVSKINDLSLMLFNEISFWWNGFISTQSSQVAVRSPYLDNDFIKVLYKFPWRDFDFASKFQLDFIRRNNHQLMSFPTTGSYGGNYSPVISGMINQFLKFLIVTDKIYIRERLPYFDSLTHWVGRLDSFFSPLQADKLIMGFTDFRRYRIWYRDQLSQYLREVLLSKRTYDRPYWNKLYLEKVVNDHIDGRGTYLREIRKVFQIEMIHRVLLEDR